MLFVTCIFALCVLDAVSTMSLLYGDICKEDETGSPWTCRTLKDCPSAQNLLKNGVEPELCGFGVVPKVCCESILKRPVRATSKSKEMCKKYGESMFVGVPHPVGGGDIRYDTCNVFEQKILIGMPADPREYPHMVLIGYGEKSSIQWLCGGSLISDQFVLGAAHCSNPRGKVARWVKLGEYNFQSKKDDIKGLPHPEYEIIERIVHPDFKPHRVYNDIALFKLKTKVVFNEHIRPACLQTEHGFHQTYAIAAGWVGTNYGNKPRDLLQKANVTIILASDCNDVYKSTPGLRLNNGITDDNMVCARDTHKAKDICQGEGPLQIRLEEPYCMYSVIGLTSFVTSQCGSDYPVVYTKVSHYVPWIESIVWP